MHREGWSGGTNSSGESAFAIEEGTIAIASDDRNWDVVTGVRMHAWVR